MSEQALWKNLRKKMVPEFWYEATRHEDKLQGGIADVSFVTSIPNSYEGAHGWMELKKTELLPVRETTIVRLPHYTDAQRIFLLEKGQYAGMSFLLLQAERDYLLFNWRAAQSVGHLTTADLYGKADWVSKGKLDAASLWEAILEWR